MRCLRCFGHGSVVLATAPRYEAPCPMCQGTGQLPSVAAPEGP